MTPLPRVWLPAFLSGLITYLCYFPANLGFLAWVALVPWFALVTAERPRARGIYAACFVGSLLSNLGSIQWIRVAHPAMYGSWAGLALFCALASLAALFIARRLSRAGFPVWLAGAVALVAVDYAKCHFPSGYTWLEPLGLWRPIGFGWYFIGHSQHDFLPLIQLADVTGVYGITFVVVVVNGVLFTLGLRVAPFLRTFRIAERPAAPSRVGPAVAVSLLVGGLAYGYWRLSHAPFADGPEIALIQGNLPQDVKNQHGRDMKTHFINLCDEAVRGRPTPEFVVWPETALAYVWCDLGPGVDVSNVPSAVRRNVNENHLLAEEGAARWPVAILYGVNREEWESPQRTWRYNSAVFVDATGTPKGTYDKIHLVPFGEYVPFRETLPFLSAFTPYEGDYSCRPGQRFTKFSLQVASGSYTFGCLICYEDSDPALARRYVTGPEPVNFLVNISNDGWFDGTEEHEQHLAISRFRAVEARRSVVRSVNMGISAIIDPAGRVVALPSSSWGDSKKLTAIVRGRVPIGTQFSPYSVVGDWLPISCWLVILGLVARRLVRPRRQVVS